MIKNNKTKIKPESIIGLTILLVVLVIYGSSSGWFDDIRLMSFIGDGLGDNTVTSYTKSDDISYQLWPQNNWRCGPVSVPEQFNKANISFKLKDTGSSSNIRFALREAPLSSPGSILAQCTFNPSNTEFEWVTCQTDLDTNLSAGNYVICANILGLGEYKIRGHGFNDIYTHSTYNNVKKKWGEIGKDANGNIIAFYSIYGQLHYSPSSDEQECISDSDCEGDETCFQNKCKLFKEVREDLGITNYIQLVPGETHREPFEIDVSKLKINEKSYVYLDIDITTDEGIIGKSYAFSFIKEGLV